jgi:hypothetical protein
MPLTEDPPVGLGPRGRTLWAEFAATRDLSGGMRLLLEEACRIADRLDKLDALLRGDAATWAYLVNDFTADHALRIELDVALGEARHQAGTLRMLIADLGHAEVVVELQPARGGALDDLTSRRAARRAASSPA